MSITRAYRRPTAKSADKIFVPVGEMRLMVTPIEMAYAYAPPAGIHALLKRIQFTARGGFCNLRGMTLLTN